MQIFSPQNTMYINIIR